MIYFISYTYLHPETGERCFDNTVTDLSEYPGKSDFKDFENKVTKELLNTFKKNNKPNSIEGTIIEEIKPPISPQVKIICILQC